jgi:SAM-dependent methyltransferase
MKLHLGAGGFYKEGYINIDLYPIGKVDRVFDCNQPLDYAANTAEEILAIHLLEHLKPVTLPAVVKSWYNTLKKGGRLVLELPDFDDIIELASKRPWDNDILKWIFGNQESEGQYHHWGWNQDRLFILLESAGFTEIKFLPPADWRGKEMPCLRVVATK